MQPFRAPRKGSEKKSATTSGKSESTVHVVPYIKGLRMMSDREATEVAQHGEVLRWSGDIVYDRTEENVSHSDPETRISIQSVEKERMAFQFALC